jgi:hypothetical protein
MDQSEKIISQLKCITIHYDTERLKSYINQVYNNLKYLIKQNREMDEYLPDKGDEILVRFFLGSAIENVKEAVENYYETFLLDSDKNKITIQEFVHCILHEFNECNKNVYIKKHKPDCKSPQKNLEKLQRYKRKKFREFENRYQVIVKNWLIIIVK